MLSGEIVLCGTFYHWVDFLFTRNGSIDPYTNRERNCVWRSFFANMAYIPHGVIITTESDKSLKGNFSILNQADPFPVSPGVTVRMVYAAQDIPIPNIPWNAAHELKGIANDNGVSFIELELAAHTQTAMHSTQSVDLGVIITGEVVLTLDTGEERVLKYATIPLIPYRCLQVQSWRSDCSKRCYPQVGKSDW